ncbi:hypothetical protein ACOSQ4_004324 [Xanthoceras sorbifolium]
MPKEKATNSWTKDAEVEVWILEPYAIKELFDFLGQSVLLILKELIRMIQLTASPLKIGLQPIDLSYRLLHFQFQGFPKDMGLLDLGCQLLLTLCCNNKLSPCLRELIR